MLLTDRKKRYLRRLLCIITISILEFFEDIPPYVTIILGLIVMYVIKKNTIILKSFIINKTYSYVKSWIIYLVLFYISNIFY